MNINLTLLMQAAAFAAFIWFTARFIWPPLMRAVDTRQKQIADGLAAGEQGKKELASAEKRIADMLTNAKMPKVGKHHTLELNLQPHQGMSLLVSPVDPPS